MLNSSENQTVLSNAASTINGNTNDLRAIADELRQWAATLDGGMPEDTGDETQTSARSGHIGRLQDAMDEQYAVIAKLRSRLDLFAGLMSGDRANVQGGIAAQRFPPVASGGVTRS